jgi:hypothetical protein
MQSEEKIEVGRFAGGIERIVEFFSKTTEAVKDLPLTEAVKHVSPWAQAVGESAGEAVAPIKFLVTLLKKATEIRDAAELAALASATAYQQAVIEAVAQVPPPPASDNLVEQLRIATPVFTGADKIDYRTLTLSTLETHEFIRTADEFLQIYAKPPATPVTISHACTPKSTAASAAPSARCSCKASCATACSRCATCLSSRTRTSPRTTSWNATRSTSARSSTPRRC